MNLDKVKYQSTFKNDLLSVGISVVFAAITSYIFMKTHKPLPVRPTRRTPIVPTTVA